MKITIIQMDIIWNDTKKNLTRAKEAIRKADASDLYVLPEMFSTGFVTNPDNTIKESGETTLQWMISTAREQDAAIAGSVATESDNTFYNRFYFVKPDGDVTYYDKRHLFTYGDEDKTYHAGQKRCTVEWRGVSFMLQVCYDLRFPVFSRNRKPYYDCCLYVANWPESRRRVWDTLLTARAMENQCYIIGVNRTGDDPVCHYNGGSCVINPYGKTIIVSPDNSESVLSVELDMERLQAFRKKFPVLEDQDTE